MKSLKESILEGYRYCTNSMVNNARDNDELLFIRSICTYIPGTQAFQGTAKDDWNHIDVFVKYPNNKEIKVDVKRNIGSQMNSNNFTLTVINNRLDELPLENAIDYYLAFIDDVNDVIYLIHKPDLYKMWQQKRYRLYQSKRDRSQYILIPKRDLFNNKLVEKIPLYK